MTFRRRDGRKYLLRWPRSPRVFVEFSRISPNRSTCRRRSDGATNYSKALPGRWGARLAQVRPLLFILEDLQWADESTLALLIHFASRVPQFPLVIIGTYRDDYAQSNPALVRSLEEFDSTGDSSAKAKWRLPKESRSHRCFAA